MPIAGSTYWNISFAVAKEQGVPYPDTDKEKKVSTNFVR